MKANDQNRPLMFEKYFFQTFKQFIYGSHYSYLAASEINRKRLCLELSYYVRPMASGFIQNLKTTDESNSQV